MKGLHRHAGRYPLLHFSQIFADLRRRKIDLSPIAVVEPNLLSPVSVTDQGVLRITGFFPTKPEQVNFDLAFQPVGGQWLLLGISVTTRPNPELSSPAD